MKIKLYLLITCIIFCSCSGQRKKNSSSINRQAETNIKVFEPISNLNFLIENSGSMDGFVNGPTEFKNILFRYISEIQNSKITLVDKISSYYINTELISLNEPISNMILKLSVGQFKKTGGSRLNTDVAEVVEKVLENLKPKEVSVLVSDFIFSPGSKYCKSADAYLVQQQNLIYNEMVKKINENSDFAVAVLRFTSLFDGKHYNKCDDSDLIRKQRPFFIWVMGNRNHVNKLISNSVLDRTSFKRALTHIYTAEQNIKSSNIDYAIQYDSSGNFEFDRKANKPDRSLINCKVDRRSGKFQFILKVDFSGIMVDSDYLIDTRNYRVNNDKYELKIREAKNNNNKYTHDIIVSSTRVIPTELKISLLRSLPSWVSEKTDLIGIDLEEDNAFDKTYGLLHQIKAIDNAFKKRGESYIDLEVLIK